MEPEIAAYYFPNYHLDKRNQVLHGKNWTEWELLKRAEPRYEGHQQPKISAWGMTDEADPFVMSNKIAVAADHGINTFIFDWYWYEDGPFLQRALHDGFLGANNNNKIKFALMWANHDWVDIHPMKASRDDNENRTILYPGAISATTFEEMTEFCLNHYFKHPSYWLIEGCPYFSIYEINKFIEGAGSLEKAKILFDSFRDKVKNNGFKDLHLNLVLWSHCILPGEQMPTDLCKIVKYLGFNSVTSYVWIHHYETKEFPQVDYFKVLNAYLEFWDKSILQYEVPYYPNVTMGWDSSPRTVQSDIYENRGYPYMYVVENNTPENFKKSLAIVKERLSALNIPTPFLTINAWNEWTEGSYLEPDYVNGMAYLEAIRQVFKARNKGTA